MGGAIYNNNYGQTNVQTLAVSHRILAFKACSARPAWKVLCLMLGAVVRQLSHGKYIVCTSILCESCGQRALNGSVLLLVTGYLT